jgi:hypothetical protein
LGETGRGKIAMPSLYAKGGTDAKTVRLDEDVSDPAPSRVAGRKRHARTA